MTTLFNTIKNYINNIIPAQNKNEKFDTYTDGPNSMYYYSSQDHNNYKYDTTDFFIALILIVLLLFILGYVFQLFWNNYMTTKLGAKDITYVEALIMYFLIQLLK
jgi:hypothetical protein